MLLDNPAVGRLVTAFRRLPGIGKRTAERLALHILSSPAEEAHFLSEAVAEAKSRIDLCTVCYNLTEENPCSVCTNEKRDRSIVCVIERPSGAMAIEKGGTYQGLYHVLHGALNPLEGIGPSELRVDALMSRLEEKGIREVIVATNATAEGEATAMYLSRRIARLDIKVTRIAHGVPMGGGLEFSDDVTLSHAIRGRTTM